MKELGPRVRVRAVEPLQAFKVLVTFDNGTRREIDLAIYLHGPIFEPMRNDPVQFRAMKIAGGAIAWDDTPPALPTRGRFAASKNLS